jgi:hypothetical protein
MEQRFAEVVEDRSTATSSLIRWGPVWAGAVIGLSLAILAAALWFALAFQEGTAVFRNHLNWWLAATAIGATLVGAFIAGLASARRGPGSGLLEGLTLWGVLVIALLAAGISTAAIFGTTFTVTVGAATYTVTTTSYWSVFWTLLIGLGAAIVGGIVGGSIPRHERHDRTIERPMPSPFAEEPASSIPPPPAADDRQAVPAER